MTDEKLNQILKHALAPEIDDKEIQIRRKEKNNMNKRKIFISGLAACAALVLVVTGIYLGGAKRSGAVAETNKGQAIENGNIFAITAYADELTEDVSSGDVVGLSTVTAGWGSSDFLNQRFTISGENIESIKVTTDKCELYTMVPVYKDDPDFSLAEDAVPNEREFYEAVFEGEPEEDHYVDHYEHLQIVGQQYEGDYNDKMYFGMSVPKELWSFADDIKQAFWEDVDQVDGATISISVAFNDGSTEEHQYEINTGKIYVPQDENGDNQWDNLTRFLTADEETETPFVYGYLMTKKD